MTIKIYSMRLGNKKLCETFLASSTFDDAIFLNREENRTNNVMTNDNGKSHTFFKSDKICLAIALSYFESFPEHTALVSRFISNSWAGY